MGAQHGKERPVPQGTGTLGGNLGNLGNLTTRSVRSKPRPPKDGRLQGNNIFTEHSGWGARGARPAPARRGSGPGQPPSSSRDPDDAPGPAGLRGESVSQGRAGPGRAGPLRPRDMQGWTRGGTQLSCGFGVGTVTGDVSTLFTFLLGLSLSLDAAPHMVVDSWFRHHYEKRVARRPSIPTIIDNKALLCDCEMGGAGDAVVHGLGGAALKPSTALLSDAPDSSPLPPPHPHLSRIEWTTSSSEHEETRDE
ncbi:LOW QUALITY PROTEIN: Translation initiation factor IF-2 [Frankliniella fusca]|uniref:Translation initiation factor IF-2 n=1 Tax=Frankliniella fusca TaxID=407009 RepID=A0AAE1HX89_9NEOP|nr:LOW QUALITY PROTEIN: Translation initiation factor IF-2 [Frankliniella fusca]